MNDTPCAITADLHRYYTWLEQANEEESFNEDNWNKAYEIVKKLFPETRLGNLSTEDMIKINKVMELL